MSKKYQVYQATMTAAGTDGLLSFKDGYGKNVTQIPLPAGWHRIISHQDITAVSGTSPTLDTKFKTQVNQASTAPTTSLLNLTDSNGTAVAHTQATAATSEVKAVARVGSDADGPGVSNAGTTLSVFADLDRKSVV